MDPKTTDPWGGDEFDPDTFLASIAKLGTTNRTKLIRFYFPGIKYEVQFSPSDLDYHFNSDRDC